MHGFQNSRRRMRNTTCHTCSTITFEPLEPLPAAGPACPGTPEVPLHVCVQKKSLTCLKPHVGRQEYYCNNLVTSQFISTHSRKLNSFVCVIMHAVGPASSLNCASYSHRFHNTWTFYRLMRIIKLWTEESFLC